MPKRLMVCITKNGECKPAKGKRSRLPLTDSVILKGWEDRILNGTDEERLAAIKEAGEMGAFDLLPVLLEWSAENASSEALKAFLSGKNGLRPVLDMLGDEQAQMRMMASDVIYWCMIGKWSEETRPQLVQALPALHRLLDDPDERVRSRIIENLGWLGHRRSAKALIGRFRAEASTYIRREIVNALEYIAAQDGGDAVKWFKSLLRHISMPGHEGRTDWHLRHRITENLKELMPEAEFDKLDRQCLRLRFGEEGPDLDHLMEGLRHPWQREACRIICMNRFAKQAIFEEARSLAVLRNRQAWITINDPSLAEEGVALLQQRIGKRRDSLDNMLSSILGIRSKQLTEAIFINYADEILDAIVLVANSIQELRGDPDLKGLLSKIRHGDDIKLRYIKREQSDLSLGDRCGDCTAKGSINYANSLMWLVNPAYQILKISKGKRFIGRINFTLGAVRDEDAIIIDAIEFNPQTEKGKPYHDDGVEAFKAAIGFLKELATEEGRALYANPRSNSSGASEILRVLDETNGDGGEGAAAVSLIVPADDISRILGDLGFRGEMKLFYQMLEADAGPTEAYEGVPLSTPKDTMDARLAELEREVVSPAQISDGAVAEAMETRDFDRASGLIIADSLMNAKVKSILNLRQEWQLKPDFLSSRLARMFASEELDARSLMRAFKVDILVRLSGSPSGDGC